MLIYSFSLFSYSEMLGLWPAGPQEARLSGEEGGKPERREGKRGRRGGEERKGEQNDCEYGRGRVGVYFENKREGKQNDSEYGRGRVSVYF